MRREIFYFNYKVIFHLEKSFMSSATNNSTTEKTKNMVSFVAVPAVECSRITFLLKPSMALYENIKTVQNSCLGLAWLCRCHNIWNVLQNARDHPRIWSKGASLSYHLEQQLSGSPVKAPVGRDACLVVCSKTHLEVKLPSSARNTLCKFWRRTRVTLLHQRQWWGQWNKQAPKQTQLCPSEVVKHLRWQVPHLDTLRMDPYLYNLDHHLCHSGHK